MQILRPPHSPAPPAPAPPLAGAGAGALPCRVRLADGRVFTGRQGMDLKLVDALGGEREAIAWLEQDKKIDKDLPVRDWKKERSLERLGLLGVSAGLLDSQCDSEIGY